MHINITVNVNVLFLQKALTMKIGCWNVNGLIENLKCSDFKTKLKQFDLIGLVETHHSSVSRIALSGYDCIANSAVRRKRKGRMSGGLVLYFKRNFKNCISHIKSASNYVMWIRFDKTFFKDMKDDLYLALIYARPNSFRSDNTLYIALEHEITKFSGKGKIALMGDINARVKTLPDYLTETHDIYIPLPDNYEYDLPDPRNNRDAKSNVCGTQLLELCKYAQLRILNGRTAGDSLGNYTCYRPAGKSVVDYLITSANILNDILYFKVEPISHHSDHCLIYAEFAYTLLHETDISDKSHLLKPHHPQFMWSSDSYSLFPLALTDNDIQNLHVNYLTHDFSQTKQGVNQALADLTQIFQVAGKKSLKTKSRNKAKANDKRMKQPWFNTQCSKLKSDLKYLSNRLRKYPNQRGIHEMYFKTLKEYKKLIKLEKWNYKNNLIFELETLEKKDPKQFWNTLNKLKQNQHENVADNIQADEWVSHFKNISNKTNKHDSEICEEELHKLEHQNPSPLFESLNNPITITEIKKNIKQMKNNKAPGSDMILNEMIKCSKSIILPALAKLFNLILETSYFPHMWNESSISLIHKKGSYFDPNNYRGISLISNLGKCFTSIMTERLVYCLENGELLHCSQAAYRKKSRTTDNMFILKSIINQHCFTQKNKLYTCFVDFKKAFDSVWREALFLKLLKLGIGGRYYSLLKSMYSETTACIKLANGLSESFNMNLGIKQGDCLSPILFNIFINDIHEIFDNTCDGVSVGNINLNHLLFADDLILISQSAVGLQKCLDKLNNYCHKWALSINTTKTKALTFHRYGKRKQNAFNIGGVPIEDVNQYTYLGVPFNTSGCFTTVENDLKGKATKASFQLHSALNSNVHVKTSLHSKLFDTLLKPIVTYGSEIWFPNKHSKLYDDLANVLQNIDKIPCENFHHAFCKRTLGVFKSSPNAATRNELGRLPLTFSVTVQVIKYWVHILNKPSDSLLRQAYVSELNACSKWTHFIKTVLDACGFSSAWTLQTPLDPISLHTFKSRLQKLFFDVHLNAKMPEYIIKSFEEQVDTHNNKINCASYLNLNIPLIHRKNISRLRLQSTRLGIVTGRYTRPVTPREERLCKTCNEIDDEKHILFTCKTTENIRQKALSEGDAVITNFSNLSVDEQFELLIYPRNISVAMLSGKLITAALKTRRQC